MWLLKHIFLLPAAMFFITAFVPHWRVEWGTRRSRGIGPRMSAAGRIGFACFFLDLYVGMLIGGTKKNPDVTIGSTIVVILAVIIFIMLVVIFIRDSQTSD